MVYVTLFSKAYYVNAYRDPGMVWGEEGEELAEDGVVGAGQPQHLSVTKSLHSRKYSDACLYMFKQRMYACIKPGKILMITKIWRLQFLCSFATVFWSPDAGLVWYGMYICMHLWSITPATYYNSLLLTTYTTSRFFRSMLRVQFLRPGTKWDGPQNSWPSPEIHGGMNILGDFIKSVTLDNRFNSYLWIIYVCIWKPLVISRMWAGYIHGSLDRPWIQ